MPKTFDNALKNKLDALYLQYSKNWLESDPIQIPHNYNSPEDIEISGFIAALFSYGKVNLFLPKIRAIMEALGESPAKAVREKTWTGNPSLESFYYRFQKADDLFRLLKALSSILEKYGSLKNLFLENFKKTDEYTLAALYEFVIILRKQMDVSMKGSLSHGQSHLIPAPGTGAMKRLNMFLRWMVRKDSVDFGIWNEIGTSKLIIPVDTHIHRMSTNLGLSRRKNADITTAIEITNALKEFAPDDPVKYDFALTRMGMFQCKATSPDCGQCLLMDHCLKG